MLALDQAMNEVLPIRYPRKSTDWKCLNYRIRLSGNTTGYIADMVAPAATINDALQIAETMVQLMRSILPCTSFTYTVLCSRADNADA